MGSPSGPDATGWHTTGVDEIHETLDIAAAAVSFGIGEAVDAAFIAAVLVVSDDNFATIVAGIEQSRVAFDNIRKIGYLLVSTGAGEVVLVLTSLAAGLPLPLLPAQLLWLNS